MQRRGQATLADTAGAQSRGERRRRRAPIAAAPACASRRWPVRVGMEGEREREKPMGRGRGGQRGVGRGRAPPSCPRAAAEVRSPPGGRRRRVGRDRLQVFPSLT